MPEESRLLTRAIGNILGAVVAYLSITTSLLWLHRAIFTPSPSRAKCI